MYGNEISTCLSMELFQIPARYKSMLMNTTYIYFRTETNNDDDQETVGLGHLSQYHRHPRIAEAMVLSVFSSATSEHYPPDGGRNQRRFLIPTFIPHQIGTPPWLQLDFIK